MFLSYYTIAFRKDSGHEAVGTSPEEVHEDDQRAGVPLL